MDEREKEKRINAILDGAFALVIVLIIIGVGVSIWFILGLGRAF